MANLRFGDDPSRRKTIFDCSPWQAAISFGVGVPIGGKIKTVYNEKGQAAESQILDADSQQLTNFSSTYDADGRLLEERLDVIDPVRPILDGLLSDESLSKLTPEQKQQAREARPQLKAQIEETMRAKFGDTVRSAGISYTYDSQGRMTTISQRIVFGEKIGAQVRNERGDIIEWQQSVTFRPEMRPKNLPEGLSAIRHSYQYDGQGNWTQKTFVYPGRDGHPDESGAVVNRKITYY